MSGNAEDTFLKILPQFDFSKNNQAHKARLKRALKEYSRELSDDELNNVSAAGTPYMFEIKTDKYMKE